MFHHSVNSKINRFYETCFYIVYSYSESWRFVRDRSDRAHVKSVQLLAIATFKISETLSVPIGDEIFEKQNNAYNLRKPSEFMRPLMRNVHGVLHGQESISYLGPKIWYMIPVEIKNLPTIVVFKRCWKMKTSELLM